MKSENERPERREQNLRGMSDPRETLCYKAFFLISQN